MVMSFPADKRSYSLLSATARQPNAVEEIDGCFTRNSSIFANNAWRVEVYLGAVGFLTTQIYYQKKIHRATEFILIRA